MDRVLTEKLMARAVMDEMEYEEFLDEYLPTDEDTAREIEWLYDL